MLKNSYSTGMEETESTTDASIAIEQDCRAADVALDKNFLAYLELSVIITIGLSFIVRRKNCYLRCCWGRPGFLQPMNFMDEIGRRWAYAACFVIVTYDIMLLFLGASHFELIPKDDEEWMSKYGWVSVFANLLEAMCTCLVFYPLLACIDNRHSIAANVVGILYLIPWIATYTIFFIICRAGEGFVGNIILVQRVPIYIALYIVGFSYVLDLVLNCMRRRNLRCMGTDETRSANDNVEKRGYEVSHHFKYVINLLKERSPKPINETKSVIKGISKKLIKRAKYEKILGFCYSTRIICSLTVSATFLIWIMILAAALYEVLIQNIIAPCIAYGNNPVFQHIFGMFCEHVVIIRILLHVANALAGLVIMGFLFNTLISYKRRWHQLLRGDHSWHMYGSTIITPMSTLFNGLKFAGYQVAYVAWGWIVLTFALTILFMFLTFALIIPLKDGVRNWLIKMLLRLWPTALLAIIIIPVAQRLICRFCFLQGKGAAMALDNRRVYNAASYYFLVLNVIIGIFSCLKRILIPLVLGVVFLSRLDRPLIMPGFETYDPGFASFVSMLLVDLYHNHPVVKTFVELMLRVREQREQLQQEQQELLTGEGEEDAVQTAEKRRSKMIRNRWLKTVTLVNNPTLALKILEQRLKDERKNAEQSRANAEGHSHPIGMQSLCDENETTSSLQVLVR